MLNSESRQLYDELKSTYERIAILERDLINERQNHEHETRALTGQLIALEEAMSSLEVMVGATHGVHTLFAHDMKDDAEGKAAILHEEGVVSCKPRRRLDKLTMSNQLGDRFLPSAVNVKAGRTNNGGEISDSGMRDMITGSSIWRRTVTYDTVSAPKVEDAILEVNLPLLFSGDRLINQIKIHPFPSASVEVAGVQVLVGGTWKDLKWSLPPQSPGKSKGPLLLHFPAVAAESVRVRVVQEVRQDRGTKSTFTLGLETLEVSHVIHYDEEQCFLGEVELQGAYGVQRIEPIFQHDTQARQFRTELYRERDGVLLPIDMAAWHTLTEQSLWVKVWLRPDTGTGVSPALQAVRIHTRKS
ncbi:hypothetical protein C0431_12335 [bacterium]|nr:hypothetical protein [bacterium]